jgi:hypothetical protein
VLLDDDELAADARGSPVPAQAASGRTSATTDAARTRDIRAGRAVT